MPHTLQQLIDGAKALADMENEGDDAFVTKQLWIDWVNQAVKELQRVEISSDPDSYFATVDFALSSTNEYTLPSDFLAIRGLTLNPGQSNRRTIHKFQFGERDRASSITDMFGGYQPSRRYRVVSRTKLMIEPQESAAGNYRLYYIPEPTRLAFPVTVNFTLDSADQPLVPPPGLLSGAGAWLLANANPDDRTDIPTSGFDLELTFTSTNLGFSGTYPVVDLGLPPHYGAPSFASDNLTSVSGYTNPATGTGTYTFQPVNTAFELDETLDRFAEYVMVCAAIKAVAKEEGDIKDLTARLGLLRQDISETVNMDANEPNTIVDTNEDWWNSR